MTVHAERSLTTSASGQLDSSREKQLKLIYKDVLSIQKQPSCKKGAALWKMISTK